MNFVIYSLCVFFMFTAAGCSAVKEVSSVQAAEKIAALEKQASSGSAESLYEQGMHHLDRGEVESGRYFLEQAAEKGNPEAIAYFFSRAHQGQPYAMVFYGDLLYLGNGVPQDVKRALQWYMAAVQHGSRWAMLRLAEAFSTGEFIGVDSKQALFWYKKAAETGLSQAQFELAEVYREGQLVPENMRLAIAWYIKAADGRHARAATFLQDFSKAENIPQQEMQPALDWLEKNNL